MINKFYSAIKQFSMLEKGDSVCVGVSGGADSMCLLDILNANKDTLGISIIAAHINHCLRGDESDRDEFFVREYCQSHNIPCRVLRVDINKIAKDTGESTELCARKVRYDFFESLNCTKTATAHTASDSAETMLMNLTRGASLNGLCSIPPVRGKIIRPLIFFAREETEKYCLENNLQYVTDSTNLSDDYTRNKFRHNVISNIKSINPSFEANVIRCISSLRNDNSFLNDYSDNVYKEVLTSDNKLSTTKLKNYHKAIRNRVIALFLSRNSDSDYESQHIEDIDLHLNSEKYSTVLPGNYKITINNGTIFFDAPVCESCIEERNFDKNNYFSFESIYGKTEIFPSEPVPLGRNEYAVDFYKIDDIISIRSRSEGDSINLVKRQCRKSLKKLFNEMKIPIEVRNAVPVLSDESGIIWSFVGGIDADRAIDKNTKKYLIIKTEVVENDK